MNFWLQYHNFDKLGYLPGGEDYDPDTMVDLDECDTSHLEASCISTGKPDILRAKGDLAFMLVGYGAAKKRYFLWSWHRIDEVRKSPEGGFDAFGDGEVLNPPARLEGTDFAEFKRANGNFGLGFQKITNSPFLPRLLELAGFNSNGQRIRRPNTEPRSRQNESANESDAVLSTAGAGFGSSERNAEVERAAIRCVTEWYEARGWSWDDEPSRQKVGYDLCCRLDGREQHVEVKGVSGDGLSFVMTENEKRVAEADDTYVVAVVLNALTVPELRIFLRDEFFNEFQFRPVSYTVTAKK